MEGSTGGREAIAAVALAQDRRGRQSVGQGKGEDLGPRVCPETPTGPALCQKLRLNGRQQGNPQVSTLYPFCLPRDEGGAGGAHV